MAETGEQVNPVGKKEPGAIKNFIAGGVGGVCVVVTGHPLDTIKVPGPEYCTSNHGSPPPSGSATDSATACSRGIPSLQEHL